MFTRTNLVIRAIQLTLATALQSTPAAAQAAREGYLQGQRWGQLRAGMSSAEVVELLGEPLIKHRDTREEGIGMVIWYYPDLIELGRVSTPHAADLRRAGMTQDEGYDAAVQEAMREWQGKGFEIRIQRSRSLRPSGTIWGRPQRDISPDTLAYRLVLANRHSFVGFTADGFVFPVGISERPYYKHPRCLGQSEVLALFDEPAPFLRSPDPAGEASAPRSLSGGGQSNNALDSDEAVARGDEQKLSHDVLVRTQIAEFISASSSVDVARLNGARDLIEIMHPEFANPWDDPLPCEYRWGDDSPLGFLTLTQMFEDGTVIEYGTVIPVSVTPPQVGHLLWVNTVTKVTPGGSIANNELAHEAIALIRSIGMCEYLRYRQAQTILANRAPRGQLAPAILPDSNNREIPKAMESIAWELSDLEVGDWEYATLPQALQGMRGFDRAIYYLIGRYSIRAHGIEIPLLIAATVPERENRSGSPLSKDQMAVYFERPQAQMENLHKYNRDNDLPRIMSESIVERSGVRGVVATKDDWSALGASFPSPSIATMQRPGSLTQMLVQHGMPSSVEVLDGVEAGTRLYSWTVTIDGQPQIFRYTLRGRSLSHRW